MDLHFTEAIASNDERDAVDEVLGLPDSGWHGGERDAVSGRSSESSRSERHLLLPVLHAVQSRISWISPGALNYLCSRLTVPPAEAYGVATFYALFSTVPQPKTVVHVCNDIACMTRGANQLCAELEKKFGQAGETGVDGNSAWKRSPCLGLCELAPAVFCQNAGIGCEDYTLAPVSAEQVLEVLREPLASNNGGITHNLSPTPPLLGDGGFSPTPPLLKTSRISSFILHPSSLKLGAGGQSLLSRIGENDPESLDDYRANGGYQALRRALEIGAIEVIRELSDSKLSGRGGAAFPTGVKWKAVSEALIRPHYIVCNADESEPGTFKDRFLMEGDPYSVIESITIAGFACGAEKGYIYIRGEYPEATRRLQNAIDCARNYGLLGDNIMSRGFEFDIEVRRGAGAYICGEETAMLESIEGKRGEPRNKPPYPVTVGLFGKPTAINNVETFVNVLPILIKGGQTYTQTGTERSTGTRLFCISGCVERPGVYELAYGGTLKEALELAGGVWQGRQLQTILLGGAAGVFLRPDELEMPLTLEGTRAANASLGSGVILVFDDTVDLKPILLRIAAFFRDESCGQCVPCRVGTVRQEEALHRLLHANGSSEKELALLDELEKVMRDASICGLGQTAASAISSAIHRLGLFKGVSTK